MTRHNLIGLLLSALIGAAMAAGVLAAPVKADPNQDSEYFYLLEQQGLEVTSKSRAKQTGLAICHELSAGTSWRSILKTLMVGADWDLDSAATVFAVAVTVYCPQLAPDLDGERSVA